MLSVFFSYIQSRWQNRRGRKGRIRKRNIWWLSAGHVGDEYYILTDKFLSPDSHRYPLGQSTLEFQFMYLANILSCRTQSNLDLLKCSYFIFRKRIFSFAFFPSLCSSGCFTLLSHNLVFSCFSKSSSKRTWVIVFWVQHEILCLHMQL